MMFDPEKLEEFFTQKLETPEEAEYLQFKLRKFWYEHVKRRPMIDKLAEERRKQIWNIAQMRLSPSERRDSPVQGFSPRYSSQELYIINTPIDKLMEDYQKSLQTI